MIFAVSVITFFLAKAAGFDPVDAYFGSELTASPEQRAALASKWGVDQPTVVQFGLWWWNLLHGDLGTSLVFERPVSAVIGDALANSSMLLFIAWLASGSLGAGLGIVAGKNRGRFLDRVISTVCYVFAAIPTFWFGIVLLLIFAVWLKWSPIGLSAPIGKTFSEATLAERLNHLVLLIDRCGQSLSTLINPRTSQR